MNTHDCPRCGVNFECEVEGCTLPDQTLCGECMHAALSNDQMRLVVIGDFNG